MWAEPVTIVGKSVRLEPLTMEHAPGLHSLYALNPDILLTTASSPLILPLKPSQSTSSAP